MRSKTESQQSLRKAGIRYLEKYAASTQSLRDVLKKRTLRFEVPDASDVNVFDTWIDNIIDQFTKNGLLNDQLFAQARANSLFRKGTSIRMIRSKLIKKGISNNIIDATIAELASEWKDPDWKAAIRFSQRKKLGPFRISKNRDDFIKRDLVSLGRAGFSFEMAKKIVYALDPENIDKDDGY